MRNNSNRQKSFDDLIEAASGRSVPSKTITPLDGASWEKHGVYRLTLTIWRFFVGPKRTKATKLKDSRFKFIAEQLISSLPDNPDKEVIEATENLLKQHRTIEDTEARRRLERWACMVIVMYLIFVFLLLILNGLSKIIWPDIFKEDGFISDPVMYAILTSTTVNIIGLGLIVLRGHFHIKDIAKGNK